MNFFGGFLSLLAAAFDSVDVPDMWPVGALLWLSVEKEAMQLKVSVVN